MNRRSAMFGPNSGLVQTYLIVTRKHCPEAIRRTRQRFKGNDLGARKRVSSRQCKLPPVRPYIHHSKAIEIAQHRFVLDACGNPMPY